MIWAWFWIGMAAFGVLALTYDYVRYDREWLRGQRRPDYERIYDMERDVYGHTFDHAGAPNALNYLPKPKVNFVRPSSGSHGLAQTFPIESKGAVREAGFRILDDRMSTLDDLLRMAIGGGYSTDSLRRERAMVWNEMRKLLP